MRYLIIHDTDPDGIASAWATKAGLEFNGHTDISLLPLTAGNPTPASAWQYDRVVYVDLSPSKEDFAVYQDMITVIDHHKSSQWLSKYPNVIHSMDHSACVLCWMHFFPKTPVPPILQYIEDRDIWKWQLPHSKEINTYIRVKGIKNIDDVAELHRTMLECSVPTLAGQGDLMLEYERRLVETKIDQFDESIRRNVVAHWKDIPLINITENVSEVLHSIIKTKNLPMLGGFFVADARVVISLRSMGAVDVAAIAQKNGGGGHHNAAGFRLFLKDFFDFLTFHPLETRNEGV